MVQVLCSNMLLFSCHLFLSKILKEKISGKNIVYSCANELSATECTCRERDVPFGEEPK